MNKTLSILNGSLAVACVAMIGMIVYANKAQKNIDDFEFNHLDPEPLNTELKFWTVVPNK